MQIIIIGKSGNIVIVFFGLCWNCGYCNFVIFSQIFFKIYLNFYYFGKVYKYVVMLVFFQEEMNKIKERDVKMYISLNFLFLYGNVNQIQEKILLLLLDGSGFSSFIKNYDLVISVVMNEDGLEEESDDEEYILEEEKKKYFFIYKCVYCNFNVLVCFKVKEYL